MVHRLGTSGWSYQGWREKFYPRELAQKEWLPFYAQHFDTVEINMSFYRFPKAETLKKWLEKTPPGFKFTLKANRQITHRKKLKDVNAEVRYFTLLADNLQDKLGCILFQLPPSLTFDDRLLEDFLSTLPPGHKNVIEFRHESWYTKKTFDLLQAHEVIFCTVSSAMVPDIVGLTAQTAYFRFHGLTGGYRYCYTDDELKRWADTIKSASVQESYVYFNNDYKAYAVENCKALSNLLKG
jgi:uncharacterized protein YecE (DUF72 family)